jgi:hypothetical protein
MTIMTILIPIEVTIDESLPIAHSVQHWSRKELTYESITERVIREYEREAIRENFGRDWEWSHDSTDGDVETAILCNPVSGDDIAVEVKRLPNGRVLLRKIDDKELFNETDSDRW